MVWNEMRVFVRKQFCKSPEEVASAVLDFKQRFLTPEKCKNYINKLHEIIGKIISVDGVCSNY